MHISDIIEELNETGCYEVEPGVFLWTQEHIIDEQEEWEGKDSFTNFDFSTSKFWLTYNEMKEPEPYDSLVEYITENY